MTAFPVRIGVDEIATGTQKCDGFTFFCLPEHRGTEFSESAWAIRDGHGLPGFHGAEFKHKKHAAAYHEFLTLAYGDMRQFPQSFAACRLFSASTKQKLKTFCDNAVTQAIAQAISPSHPSAETLQPYFLPLACLAALSRELAPEVQIRVEMDSHSSFADLDETAHTAHGVDIPAGSILKGLYNGYATELHERTPLLPDDGVTVLQDESSAMIQAADVIGNFAMAHMFVLLGKETPGRLAKSEILQAVFGDDVNEFDPAEKLTFSGDDLILTEEGSITFSVAWGATKPLAKPELMKNWPEDDGFLGRKIE